jgi:drug/metabolite transporter (DMT)-like permease
MRIVREARPRLRTVGAAIAALLVLLVVLSPTLLFGQSVGAFDLLLVAASLLGVGLLLRRGGGTDTRPLGTILVIIGVVLLAFVAALMALLLAGWGRGI